MAIIAVKAEQSDAQALIMKREELTYGDLIIYVFASGDVEELDSSATIFVCQKCRRIDSDRGNFEDTIEVAGIHVDQCKGVRWS